LILTVSTLTGITYHLAFLGSLGSIETFLGVGVLTCVNFCAILAARRAYQPQNLANVWRQVQQTTIAWLFVFFVLSAVAFAFKITETYSRGATLAFFVVGWFAIVVWRTLIARFLAHALAVGAFAEQKAVLIVEQGQLAGSSVVEKLKHCGYNAVRTFEFAADSLASPQVPFSLSRAMEEIVRLSRQEPIDCVFMLVSWTDRRAIEHLVELLRILSVPIYLLPDRQVAHFLGSRMVNIGTAWAAELKRAPLTTIERACKRTLDLLIASAVLVMLAPMMVVVAAVIKLESRGPVLFMQTRNGFNGRPFRMCKFRTMHVLEDGAVIRQATKDDPRVTRLGRLLRRANVDELPQLLNVIVGDMSLVGPRPHAAAHNSEYEKIIANYAYRYHVKPGLTGWAQVNGLRGETRTVDLMERRVEFDVWYITNWSLWLDFRILLRTLIMGLQPTAY
jgi:Undecaprenyl-phosphate glucose phosphotransferase